MKDPHRIGMRLAVSLLSLAAIALAGPAWAEARPKVVIIPFVSEGGGDTTLSATCAVCGGVHEHGAVPTEAVSTLTAVALRRVMALEHFDVVPLSEVRQALADAHRSCTAANIVDCALETADDLEADFAIVGVIFRYAERIGSSVAAQQPATVAFDIHVIRSRDGQTVWGSSIDETQRPLFDNVLQARAFFQHRARWVTAAELAETAIGAALKRLPGLAELNE